MEDEERPSSLQNTCEDSTNGIYKPYAECASSNYKVEKAIYVEIEKAFKNEKQTARSGAVGM